jgi:ribonuclease HI
MESKGFQDNLINVYVDASAGKRDQPGGKLGWVLAHLVEGQRPKNINFDSSLNFLQRKIQTHEAEYLAIISALTNVEGNLRVFSDNKPVVRALQKEKITPKNDWFVRRIRELTKDRIVKFEWVARKNNPAGRHLQGSRIFR